MVPDSLFRICAQYLTPRQWLSHCIPYSCFLSSVLKTRWPHLGVGGWRFAGFVPVHLQRKCPSEIKEELCLTWCRRRCRKKCYGLMYWPSFVCDAVIKHSNEKQPKEKGPTVDHNSGIQFITVRKAKQQKQFWSQHIRSQMRRGMKMGVWVLTQASLILYNWWSQTRNGAAL